MPDLGDTPLKTQKNLENENKMIERLKVGLGLYLLSVTLILAWIAIDTLFSQNNDKAIHIFIYVAVAGGLGATIASMIAFSGHIANDKFSEKYIWWYVFRPAIGIILGIVTYLLIVGGLLGLTNENNIDYTQATLQVTLFSSALAFIAGFASKQVSNKLKELSTTLFTVKEQESNNTNGGESNSSNPEPEDKPK